eukprot:6195834-Pleurochrysis_carterae.AAC.1
MRQCGQHALNGMGRRGEGEGGDAQARGVQEGAGGGAPKGRAAPAAGGDRQNRACTRGQSLILHSPTRSHRRVATLHRLFVSAAFIFSTATACVQLGDGPTTLSKTQPAANGQRASESACAASLPASAKSNRVDFLYEVPKTDEKEYLLGKA